MPRINALPQNTEGIADTDLLATHNTSTGDTEKTTFAQLKEWLQSLTSWISFAMLDSANYDDVAFEAANAGTVNSTNLTPQTIATINITVTKTTKVLCIGTISASATADTEYSPSMTLDGGTVKSGPAGAVVADTSARYIVRSMSAIYTLSPGAHTIVFRIAGSAGTLSVLAGRGQLTTSLASLKN